MFGIKEKMTKKKWQKILIDDDKTYKRINLDL